jgi:hypothetical protein
VDEIVKECQFPDAFLERLSRTFEKRPRGLGKDDGSSGNYPAFGRCVALTESGPNSRALACHSAERCITNTIPSAASDCDGEITDSGFVDDQRLVCEVYAASEDNNVGKAEHGSGDPPRGLSAHQQSAFCRFGWEQTVRPQQAGRPAECRRNRRDKEELQPERIEDARSTTEEARGIVR